MSLTLSASPEELRKGFSSLKNREDIAKLLDIDVKTLIYHLYRVPESERYKTFEIPKSLGGTRTISAPVTTLKIIQRKLNQVLQSIYKPRNAVHSYVHKRSILTNASGHSQSVLIFNIDLKDFFPSIHLGRVIGLFKYLNREPIVATTLAQICCFNRVLPQGAPTSPIISNMICATMDKELSQLARKYDCNYTRYADDITFSTEDSFPTAIVKFNTDGQLEVGDELGEIISTNSFEINRNKVTLRNKDRRQIVTGLVINEFPNVRREYVRKIRAMLHAWEKFGLEAAETEFLSRYHNSRLRNPSREPPSFKRVVKGKIDYLGMVRGKDHPIYLHFRHKLRELAPELVKEKETPLEFLIRTSRTVPTKYALKPLVTTEHDTEALSHLLSSVDPLLEEKRLGAWMTFKGSSTDRIAQATHSMRELLRQLLDKLAPDEDVKRASWYSKPTEDPEVTKRMRVRYILSGYDSTINKKMVDFIDSIADAAQMTYSRLNSEAHKYGRSIESTAETYLEACELVIKLILLHRNVQAEKLSD
jgi:RNA-directed DNA polymerase